MQLISVQCKKKKKRISVNMGSPFYEEVLESVSNLLFINYLLDLEDKVKTSKINNKIL